MFSTALLSPALLLYEKSHLAVALFMEAAGIEPASRDVSASASTCVVAVLVSRRSGPPATRSVPAKATGCPVRRTAQLPDSEPAAWRPFRPRRRGQKDGSLFKRPGPIRDWHVTVRSRCFTRPPGTWARHRRFHRPVESSSPPTVLRPASAIYTVAPRTWFDKKSPPAPAAGRLAGPAAPPGRGRPHKRASRRVRINVILIIADTVRAGYLGCYGSGRVRTPRLDALAAGAVRFTDFHCGSFPTGPMRKDVQSGRFTFPYCSWHDPRPAEEELLSELLTAGGVRTAFIGDTNNSKQYRLGFEHENVISARPAKLDDVPERVRPPADPRKLRGPDSWTQKVCRHAAGWDGEADRRCAL